MATTPTFAELQIVKLTQDVEADEAVIPRGTEGTVVHVFKHPNEAYLVEVADENGKTLAMVTALPEQIEVRAT